MKIRIQKLIAQEGTYSRRAVERLIQEHKVKVNGIIVTTQGVKVDPAHDRIQVDGKAFKFKAPERYTAILLNKPRHVMVTRADPEGRPTVYDLLPEEFSHLKPVGRLDCTSQGALILTDDGELILKLTHPRYEQEKIYEVKLSCHPEEKQLNRLRRGVLLDGVRTLPAVIEIIEKNKTSTLLRFHLREGKNRQIRRMCEVVGLTVKELIRVAIGPIHLKKLRSGQFRFLSEKEIYQLMNKI
jgi:pseudouridine synthase